MKTPQGLPSLPSIRHYYLIAIGGFVLASLIAIVVPIRSLASRSVRPGVSHAPSAPRTKVTRPIVEKARSNLRFESLPIVPAPTGETIAVLASDCTTPKSVFQVGDTVCIVVSGVPLSTSFPRHVTWECPNLDIPQSAAITSDPQTGSLLITPTFTVGGSVADSRGTWRVVVRNPFFLYPEATASFTVSDQANPEADIGVASSFQSDSASVGSSVVFGLQVTNYGPDSSANVQLTDALPAGASFVSFSQTGGPAFACNTDTGGNTTCTIAILASGAVATFTANYQVASGSSINNTANLSADTADINSLNNTTTTSIPVTSTGGGGTCALTCPEDVTASANTTEGGQRGAHVSFPATVGSGNCGSITTTPASGSFFPVGTTTINSTSETGGGSCSFTVTVNDTGSNPPTISCPANQSANADSNCSASVNVGTATATGDNVTLWAQRSDGQLVYDCDVNGNCTRRSSDAPFSAGTNTIIWFAYAHDIAGPYTTAGPNPGDTFEEQHRTGTASCTQTIEVVDVTPPSINAPNTSASADGNCLAPVPNYSTLATVSDNCSCSSSDTSETCQNRQTITVTQNPAAGSLVGLGPHTINLTANDGSSNNGGAGNSTTIQVTFTVNDTTPPTFTFVPPMVTAYTGAGATTCDTVVSNATLGTPTATDNCSAVTFTRSPTGNTFPVGDTTIVWSAHDVAGNVTTANQVVRVIDNTPPQISCPSSQVLEPTCPSGAIATWTAPVGTDNCPGAVTTRTAGGAPGTVFPIGTTTVTYSVTDAAGNGPVTCSFTVTVKTVNQTILDMEAYVNSLPLSGTQKQGLNAKLEQARTAPNTGVACNKLADFNSQVTAYINNGTLTSAQGNALLSSSNHVRNTIGCTNNPCT